MDDLVDTRAAAKKIGMSYDWLRKRVKAGLVECHRFGSAVRFSPEQIAKIKADHLQPVAPAVADRSLATVVAMRAAQKPKPKPQPRPRPVPKTVRPKAAPTSTPPLTGVGVTA